MTTLMLSESETLTVCPNDEAFEVEATYAPHGSPPLKHLHRNHDEQFTVLTGTLNVVLDGEGREFASGQTFDVPHGTVHCMWNASPEPTTVRWLSTPAGRVEEYFTAIDRLHREGKASQLRLAGVLHAYPDVMVPESAVTRIVVRVVGPFFRPAAAGDR